MSKVFQPTKDQKVSFELWAKTQHCNLRPSPYPENFRTYKFDRTQHMLEGWLAAIELENLSS